MDLSAEHKKEVQRRIMDTLLTAYEKLEINRADFDEISKFILERDPTIQTHHDLIVFLRELTAKWKIFSFVLTLENGEVSKIEENKAVEKIEDLTQEGKIDEALEAARKIVKNINDQ
ncbi:MAG: hypothetical protein HY344_03030 [Candidatus Levybacteria bacterium]|nr:hypothetical protein [Candidatus Levybacteria bacterium]